MVLTHIIEILYGALTQGIIWSVMAMGVFLSFRVLDFADMTCDGSLTLGGAVAATVITNGGSPIIGLFMALFAGLVAGSVTALLHTKLGIPGILSGILTQSALYSINLSIMGKANVSLYKINTLFSQMEELTGAGKRTAELFVGLLVCGILITLICLFLNTEVGFAVRATGNNQRMIRAQGVNTDSMIILCLMLANGAISTGGSLVAMSQGFADIGMGIGGIVIGLAAVIIGEEIFGKQTLLRHLIAIVLGSIVYRMLIALVLEFNLNPNHLKLFTAILVACSLSLPTLRKGMMKGKALKEESVK